MTGFEIIWTIIGFIVLVLLIIILRTRLIIYTGRKRNYKVEYVICAAHDIRTDGKWINELFMHLKEKYPMKDWYCPFIAAAEIFPPTCVREMCVFYDEESSNCLLVSRSR